MNMMNDSDKFSQRMKWIENLLNFDDQNFKYLFWFFSLLTIPVFTYLYTLPLTLFVWLMAKLIGLGDKSIDVFTKFGVGLCFIAALVTQYQLWKMYKKKRSPINREGT